MNATNDANFKKAKVHVDITPAEALKNMRLLQGLSQSQLSALTGISQPNISAYENGVKQLGRENAIVFAKALKVHPAVLLFPDYMSDVA